MELEIFFSLSDHLEKVKQGIILHSIIATPYRISFVRSERIFLCNVGCYKVLSSSETLRCEVFIRYHLLPVFILTPCSL